MTIENSIQKLLDLIRECLEEGNVAEAIAWRDKLRKEILEHIEGMELGDVSRFCTLVLSADELLEEGENDE